MRVRMLIDVETDDIPRLQRYVAEQPAVSMHILQNDGQYDGVTFLGRFVGAKEAYDSVEEVATAPDPKA